MLLCVTGPMAAGKNAAAEILAQRHQFAVVDADELAHDAAEQAKAQIVQEFGAMAAQRGIRLLREDGSLDRRAVGALIFSDPELVRRQEAIVYPQINRMFDEFITAHSGQDIAIN
ncbi:MAG TPA: dephospho-CoA kinase, partial [Treponema sp.]|nr:dephospho-CoA kinase [Treponema sp.]